MKKIILFILVLPGCSFLDNYSRSYSIGYEDEGGHRLDFGIELSPIEPRK